MRAVIVLTGFYPVTRSLYLRDGDHAWSLNSSVSGPAHPEEADQIAVLNEGAASIGLEVSATEFERVTVEDVREGDLIAKARSHPFSYVDSIGEGPVSRNLRNANGQTIMRPRRSVKLWRVT